MLPAALRRLAQRVRRVVPPILLFGGLFFFGLSLVLLGMAATRGVEQTLDPSSLTFSNGTALLLYPVERFYLSSHTVNVTYEFPQGPGNAYFVGCADVSHMRNGSAPTHPLLAFTHLRSGAFVASAQTVTDSDPLRIVYNERSWIYCAPTVAFQWSTTEAEVGDSRPRVAVVHRSGPLDEDIGLFVVLMGGSALAALLGGLAWARSLASPSVWPTADESPVEALRASLDRMGAQLERTRKHLLFAGILGVFLWYPFLVPWAWQQASRASEGPVLPWIVAGLTLAFLLVLTLLWAREFLRLDRELNAWRGRLGQLREREARLMDSFEDGG